MAASRVALEHRREYDRIRQEALRRKRGAQPKKPRPSKPVFLGSEYERVPNGPLREAFLRSGLTAAELAIMAGYMRKRHGKDHLEQADQELVKRMLGLVDPTGKPGEPRQKTIAYKHAVRLVRAMGLLPADYGV